MSNSKDNIKVALRIRPLNSKEVSTASQSCVYIQNDKEIVLGSSHDLDSSVMDSKVSFLLRNEFIGQEDIQV